MAEKDALLSFILFFRLTFTQSPTFTEESAASAARRLPTLAVSSSRHRSSLRDWYEDLALEVHFDCLRGLRVNFMDGKSKATTVERLHRSISRTDRQ